MDLSREDLMDHIEHLTRQLTELQTAHEVLKEQFEALRLAATKLVLLVKERRLSAS